MPKDKKREKPTEADLQATRDKNTYQIGDKKLSKEEYNTAKGALGFDSGTGGKNTNAVKDVVASQATAEENRRAGLTEKDVIANKSLLAERELLAQQIATLPPSSDAKSKTFIDEQGNVREAQAGAVVGLDNLIKPNNQADAQIRQNQAAGELGQALVVGAATTAAVASALAVGPSLASLSAGTGGLLKASASVLGVGGVGTLITSGKRQIVKDANKNVNGAIAGISATISDLNAGLISPKQAMEQYALALDIIYTNERVLKRLSSGPLNLLTGASDELLTIEQYRRFSEGADREALRQAILLPDPNKIILDTPEVQQ